MALKNMHPLKQTAILQRMKKFMLKMGSPRMMVGPLLKALVLPQMKTVQDLGQGVLNGALATSLKMS